MSQLIVSPSRFKNDREQLESGLARLDEKLIPHLQAKIDRAKAELYDWMAIRDEYEDELEKLSSD